MEDVGIWVSSLLELRSTRRPHLRQTCSWGHAKLAAPLFLLLRSHLARNAQMAGRQYEQFQLSPPLCSTVASDRRPTPDAVLDILRASSFASFVVARPIPH